MGNENEINFILSVDSSTGRMNVEKFTQSLKSMGVEGVKSQDALSDAVGRTFDKMSGNARRTEAQFKEMIKVWHETRGAATSAGDGVEDFGDKSDRAGGKASQSFKNAGIAARGLAQEIGVTLPNSVSAFLAQSKTIGPLLTAAFSVVAVVGMIEVLGQIPAVFDRLSSSITGWDSVSKAAYANFLSDNKKAEEAALKTAQAQRGIQEIGIRSPAARAAFEAGTVKEEIERRSRIATEKLQAIAQTETQMKALEQHAGLPRMILENGPSGLGPNFAKMQELTATKKSLEGDLAGITQELIELHGVALPKAMATATDAAKKEREELKNLNLELGLRLGTMDFSNLANATMGRNAHLINIPGMAAGAGDIGDQVSAAGVRGVRVVTPSDAFGVGPYSGANNGAIIEAQQNQLHQVLTAIKSFDSQATAEAAAAFHYQVVLREAQYERERKLVTSIAETFRDSFGRAWDDMAIKGQGVLSSFRNFAAAIGNSFGRTLFQGLGNALMTGSFRGVRPGQAVGGLLGLSSKIPGVASAIGLGTAGMASATAAPMIAETASISATGAATYGTTALGAGAMGGGASILGMSAATAIPVIGAAVLGGVLLTSWLLHRRHKEEEASVDPFSNIRNRSMFFNATFPFEKQNQDLKETLNRLNGTLSRVDTTLDGFDSMSPGDVVTVGAADAAPAIIAAVDDGLTRDRATRKSIAGSILEDTL